MDDQVTFLHPCKVVRTPPVPRKPLQIITPEQFDQIYQALPVADYQLLVETEIESGLRWGELTERRVKDLDGTRVLTVSRAVVEVNPKYHPTQGRFLVKDYVGEPSGLLQLQDEQGAGLLADARPVTAEAPAAATGEPLAQARAHIEAAAGLGYEVEDGALVGAALTLRPTRHRFRLRGHDLYTWCGFDALFLPIMLGEQAEVASTCPITAPTSR
jgi:hypothetical protein